MFFQEAVRAEKVVAVEGLPRKMWCCVYKWKYHHVQYGMHMGLLFYYVCTSQKKLKLEKEDEALAAKVVERSAPYLVINVCGEKCTTFVKRNSSRLWRESAPKCF